MKQALRIITVALACTPWLAAKAQDGFDWKKYDGQTITFLSSNHPWPNAVLPNIEEFTKLTGIKVRVETYNEQQMWQRLATMLQAKSPEVDVYMTLNAREGQLYFTSGWYQNLATLIDDPKMTSPDYDFADFNPALVPRADFKGQVTYIPLNIEGPVVYYRKDVFEQCKLAPPKTLQEIEPTAAKLKACRPELVPWVTRGLRGALPYTYGPFYYNMGGTWDKIAERKDMCSEAGAKSLQYYTDLLNKFGPPGASNYTFYQITEIMGQGRAAMSFEASNEFGKLMSYPGRQEDIAIEVLPPDGETKISKPLTIGWGIAISAFSKNVGPSWYFLQWATSKAMDEKIAFNGVAPPRKSVFEGDKFKAWIAEKPNRQQWVDALGVLAATGVGTAAPPEAVPAPEANDIIGATVQDVLLGQTDAKAAGCAADEKMKTLLGK